MEQKNGHECYNVMATELREVGGGSEPPSASEARGGAQGGAEGGAEGGAKGGALGVAHVGFLTEWRPGSNVRERSDVAYIYGCKGKGKGACARR